jgi:hypothetical protein
MAINVRVKHIVTIVAIIAALGVIAYVVSSLYHLSDTIQGAIVGGIIGFGSSIGVNLIQAYTTRPILSIGEQIREWDIDLYPEYMEEDQDELRPSYWSAARIIVENQGRTAAKDCKASIIVNGIGTRVAWMIPKNDFTVTINAHDTELIGLCALHPKAGLLFTTEHGYGKKPKDAMGQYRRIVGQLKVSASNAEQSVRDIWISSTKDSGGKFVYFSKPEGFE